MRKSKYTKLNIKKSKKKIKQSKNEKPIKNKKILLYTLLIIFLIFLIVYIVYLKFENIKLSTENKLFMNETIQLQKDIAIIKNITLNSEYYFYRLLCPKEVIGKKKVLYGAYGDGGYVLLDDLTDIKIAYSFGISNIISFDKALADKGIDVYMYDHTIRSLPYYNPKFHWKKIGLAGEAKKNFELKTLNELLIENGHTQEKNMILKIDIEDNEWDTLNEISDSVLNQFKYIIMEFHFWKIEQYLGLYMNCLKKLMKFHQIFHIHCCNCIKLLILGDNPICNTIEVSYIKKEGNEFKKDESIYPVKGFDYKICNHLPSMDLEPNILKYCNNIN